MPTWSGLLAEIQAALQAGNPPDLDGIRRRYLLNLRDHTKRNVILYATKFTQRDPDTPPDLLSIVDEDIQGLMEVIHGLKGKKLDLILHSPGGSLDAVESLVVYLRSKFNDIRVIVPHLAQSAATMLACAANAIVLGKHSFLGPTDPQIRIQTQNGPAFVPAQAIIDQFERAKSECSNPKNLPAWLPMLGQYGPSLLVTCENATNLSQQLVADWIYSYMLKKAKGSRQKADKISEWLSSHKEHKSHGRHITRQQLKSKGLNIVFLESDQKLQDHVLSIFHATSHTFSMTGAAKIIENHKGKAFVKIHRAAQVQKVLVPQSAKPKPKIADAG